MKKLNLPSFEFKIKEGSPGLRIFDIIRKKYILLTPEEWVRQHFLHYLIDHLGYPKSLIKVESGLKYNRMRKRSDIVVFDNTGSAFMLVECKSSETKVSKDALFQVTTYNRSVKAKYVVVTNGMGFICSEISEGSSELIWMDSLPRYPIQD